MAMNWWGKMMTPMRKVWTKVSKRFGLRKHGLVKLHQDVRFCEYEDVHILWDMLKRNQMDLTSEKKPFWKLHWSKCSPLLCRAV
ncbi:hypothetical protein PHJA_002548500 [Phtheirospermum japonicum]|uniref:Uncharacterized protein n=1 Tax=Phtheirospermum japonicum TaxID=374723 RepID=A0A830DAD3_9LAMI|nr:hypothetical protein PHJA_002548500 [Phtheirospermum japonicum]